MADRSRPQWVRIGRELRRLRLQAGLTQDELAKRLNMSYGTISGIERGVRGTTREVLAQIDHLLSTGGSLQRMWEALNSYNGLPEWFRGVAELERESSEIREYHPLLIPGPLQTEAYIRTILRIGSPALTDEEIEEQVRGRLDRQAILTSERPPILIVVLDETVLRRPFGGRETMGRQLEHLLMVGERPRVTIQVVPIATHLHPGLDGAFHLFTVPHRGQVLYTETRNAGNPVEDPDAIADYTRVFGELRGAALPEATSRDLIASAIGELP
ncbi:XRE family transcriptional regulator [Nocardiopsis gilva YIM 90087]|uniref:XRE family transcriptional regulator n=2 Tax=Nocardiopsis gilva TaxID=280236 RepID=A0A223SDF8_9ACTN|nr:helix-turn-helix transcriptional regulator [Nocardiopsis gilva]ASU86177.1 XRE family transcriptional regulator [Nocardiopsis gilva YIM 90087]